MWKVQGAILLTTVQGISAFVAPVATPGCAAFQAGPVALRPSPITLNGEKKNGGLFGGLFEKKPEKDASSDDETPKRESKSEPRRTIGGGASPWNSKAPKGAKSSFFARNLKKGEDDEEQK